MPTARVVYHRATVPCRHGDCLQTRIISWPQLPTTTATTRPYQVSSSGLRAAKPTRPYRAWLAIEAREQAKDRQRNGKETTNSLIVEGEVRRAAISLSRINSFPSKLPFLPLSPFSFVYYAPSRDFTSLRRLFLPHYWVARRACLFLPAQHFPAVAFYYYTLTPTVHFAPVIWHPLRPPSTKSNTSITWSSQRKISTSNTTSMTTSPSVLPKSSVQSNPSLHPRAFTNPPPRR
jgi:hypothetical protein